MEFTNGFDCVAIDAGSVPMEAASYRWRRLRTNGGGFVQMKAASYRWRRLRTDGDGSVPIDTFYVFKWTSSICLVHLFDELRIVCESICTHFLCLCSGVWRVLSWCVGRRRPWPRIWWRSLQPCVPCVSSTSSQSLIHPSFSFQSSNMNIEQWRHRSRSYLLVHFSTIRENRCILLLITYMTLFRSRIRRIPKFLGLPESDPFVGSTDPDSDLSIKQKL